MKTKEKGRKNNRKTGGRGKREEEKKEMHKLCKRDEL